MRDDRLSRATIYRLLQAKQLEAIKIGKRTMLLVASIERLKRNAPRYGEPAKA